MSLLSKLFGGGSNSTSNSVESIEYEGFRITPEPMKEGGKFRICALIEKDIDGGPKTHRLVRADLIDAWDEAVEVSTRKAKQMIDEQGERLF